MNIVCGRFSGSRTPRRDLRRLLALGLGCLVGVNVDAAPRLWTQATPAAGVEIRSATNFRASAIATAGSPRIDVFQRNANGSSTKLGTLVATTGVAVGASFVASSAMRAIYWQFAAPPAVSTAPPPAQVRFFNDQPAIPITALYYGGSPTVPFAPNDPTLLLNADFRKGLPAGWTSAGTGRFDSVNGYTPGRDNGAAVFNASLPAFASSAPMPTGTIAVRLQRTGVATDNSFGSLFWDSTGNTANATTSARQLFFARSNSGYGTWQVAVQPQAIPYLEIRSRTNSMANYNFFSWQTVNSHFVPGFQDSTFADLLITWYQNQYYVFFDGHLVTAGVLADVPIYQMMQNICIGNYNGGASPSGAPFGPYYVQQFQVSTRFLGPVLAGPPIGLLPDSFAAAYTVRATPTATAAGGAYRISDVDAVQTALGLYSGMNARNYQPGQSAVFHQIQALFFSNFGFFPPIYNAGQPGHGYSHINAPIDDAYIAALNAAGPAVVMAGGSVNDNSPFNPPDANLMPDTQVFMNRLVVGGGVQIAAPANPSLTEIVYLETLSSQGVPNVPAYPEPAYANESQNLISLSRATLPSFAPPNAVRFTYVKSREWWNESPSYPLYLFGTNPANRFNRPGGASYADIHPDPSGYSVIASHLYAPIAAAYTQTAGSDLSVSGAAAWSGTGSVSISLSVVNSGPAASSGETITAVLPPGLAFLSSSPGVSCTISSNTLSCTVGSIGAGSTAILTLNFRASQSSIGALSLAVAGAAGSVDINASNNSALVNIGSLAPPADVTSDAPLPLPAVIALALSMLAIGARRLNQSRGAGFNG